MTWLPPATVSTEPPLDPAPADARSLLRRELLRPEYQERDLVGRVLRWLERQLNRALQAASDVPPLSVLAALLIGLVLVLALLALGSRVRSSGRRVQRAGEVLGTGGLSADDLRARAEVLLSDGRHGEALLDAFRALAVRHVERGGIGDMPGATVREVAEALAAVRPARADDISEAARLFEGVLYGHRPAERAQVEQVLALDEPVEAR